MVELLVRLDWDQLDGDLWSDGWTLARICDEADVGPMFGFQSEASCCSTVQYSPAGFSYGVEPMSELDQLRPKFCLNHVALDVPYLDAEAMYWQRNLGVQAFIQRDSVLDPVSNETISDCHIQVADRFYLTLRGRGNVARIDHIGWMAKSLEDVCEALRIVKDLSWDIVVPVSLIDTSYLFHFRSPNGQVHDFFAPQNLLDAP